MLTATYSILALSIEQEAVRAGLNVLQHDILRRTSGPACADPAELESACDQLAQFDEYCHNRKVEMYVIPVVRRVTREADPLLAELESLSAHAMYLLRGLRSALRLAIGQGAANLDECRRSAEQYFSNLYKRLRKEEELFRIAQRVISGDEWFALATNFLTHDGQVGSKRRSRAARSIARIAFRAAVR